MAAESTLAQNYTKGEVVVLEGDAKQQFPDVPENTVIVNVKRGSKMRNILGFALAKFTEESNRHIIFTGSGDAIEKTISCVEIVKTKQESLHQITRITYTRIEEYWEPKTTELDRLKATREIPTISILLSKDALNPDDPGYQGPDDPEFHSHEREYTNKPKRQKPYYKNVKRKES